MKSTTETVQRDMNRLISHCSVLAALLLISLASVSTAIAAPSPARITEFPLGTGDFYPHAITAGPDGNLWFVLSSGIPGRAAMDQSFTTGIDRITPTGQITGFPLSGETEPRSMTAGPDGNVWFGSEREVGRIAPDGQITTFPVRMGLGGKITSGREGNLWFTQGSEPGLPPAAPTDRVNQMTTSGQVTAFFPLPHSEAGLSSIVADLKGSIWFTETFGNEIGRITPEGQITEFPLPVGTSYPSQIAVGPEGNLWFVEEPGGKPGLGRITPSGRITQFPLDADRDRPGQIVAGADGRLWFVDGPAQVGRITPSGRITRIMLPNRESNLAGLAAGPEGAIWYAAAGEPPIEGGGGTQMAHVYKNPGIVGRIMPGPLTVRIATGSAKTTHRRARVGLSCGGGHATSVCRGRIQVGIDSPKGRTMTLASGRYSLPVDLRRQVGVRLTDRGAALLSRHPRLRTRVSVSLAGKNDRVREIVLHR